MLEPQSHAFNQLSMFHDTRIMDKTLYYISNKMDKKQRKWLRNASKKIKQHHKKVATIVKQPINIGEYVNMLLMFIFPEIRYFNEGGEKFLYTI